MSRNTSALAAAAMAIGLVASACGHSSNSATTPTSTATTAQLQSLIPTPANTQRTDGPTSIGDNGIHLHYLVNGGGNDVLGAYKTALEGKGWTVTVITSGGWDQAVAPPTPGPRAPPTACSAEEATAAPPTSVPAHGRQSQPAPTVVAAPINNVNRTRHGRH
jgi:hypothetical protein